MLNADINDSGNNNTRSQNSAGLEGDVAAEYNINIITLTAIFDVQLDLESGS